MGHWVRFYVVKVYQLAMLNIKLYLSPFISFVLFPAVGCKDYQQRTVFSFHIRRRLKFLDHKFTNNFKRRYQFFNTRCRIKKNFQSLNQGRISCRLQVNEPWSVVNRVNGLPQLYPSDVKSAMHGFGDTLKSRARSPDI